ncbi:MAG: rod shape-determining protein MreC [Ignavibacteriaceae bacterium]|nr:rod shape-determining protein MreC [Ignavibacteriaceae bacterium]
MVRFFRYLWENFKEYIILIILILLSLGALSLNQQREIKKVRAVAFGSFAFVTSFISDLVNISSLKNENERLREINAELMLQVNKLRQYGIENQELRSLLNLKDTTKYPIHPASVVSRSLSRSQGTITINVGRNDSIKPGMPVFDGQGLIGIIYSTSEDFSLARTLFNTDLKLTVKNERSRVNGIMKWNGENLVIVDVPKTYDIQEGDRVVTSELSSIVNVPIPIGVVIGISKVEVGIFNEVQIKPFSDINGTENVFVLKVVESKQKNDLELNFFNRK